MLTPAPDFLAHAVAKVFNHIFSSGLYPNCMGYRLPSTYSQERKCMHQNVVKYSGINIKCCLGNFQIRLLIEYLEDNSNLSDNQAAYGRVIAP